jgi:hypothetical protein
MNDQELKNALLVILERLKGKEVLWRLEGTANLRVLGVEVTPADLDIKTDKAGLDVFRDALKEFVVKDYYNQSVAGRAVVCKIGAVVVEIIASDDPKYQMLDRRVMREWNGLQLWVLPIKDAHEFYLLTGRQERVALIDAHMAKAI